MRVAELVPWDGSDAGCCKLERDPEDRGGGEGEAGAAGDFLYLCKSQAKESEVEAENEAEADEKKRWRHGRHVAVLHHGVADPIAITHVPEDAAKIGEKKGATEGTRLGEFCSGENRPEERNQSEPSED